MNRKIPAFFNWSGGKDSALALYTLLKQGDFEIKQLLTTINAVHQRVSMHGVRRGLLQEQAASLGFPLSELLLPENPSMEVYNQLMNNTLLGFRKRGIEHAVFGDIFLEDLKKYRDEKLAEAGFTGIYPLWQQDSRILVERFIDLGFRTIVVCCNSGLLDESFCGRIIDRQFLADLPENVDPAGENGEFHTFVFDGPIFKKPVSFETGEKVYRCYPDPGRQECDLKALEVGFWFQDLVPVTQ